MMSAANNERMRRTRPTPRYCRYVWGASIGALLSVGCQSSPPQPETDPNAAAKPSPATMATARDGRATESAPPQSSTEPPQATTAAAKATPPSGTELQSDATMAVADFLPQGPGKRVAAASRALDRGDADAAEQALAKTKTSAAALIRARIARQRGNAQAALRHLEGEESDSPIAELVVHERALARRAAGDSEAAAKLFLSLFERGGWLAKPVSLPLLELLPERQPKRFLQLAPKLEAVLPPAQDNPNARSLFLHAKALALEKLGKDARARDVRLTRYLEEPVAKTTPTTAPEGVTLSALQRLQRAEVLLEAHRNTRALRALEQIDPQGLTPPQQCRRDFGLGLAARKLRRYSRAEQFLGRVLEQCKDADLRRRAAYLHAKVVSIRDGLRAIEPIERFAKEFAGHTMVDDVLFWAGDLYQRRDRRARAAAYYRRAQSLPTKGDYCAESRWRLAWMAYRGGELETAAKRLERMFANDGCADEVFARARAHYWLGRIAAAQQNETKAREHFEAVLELSPLGFYAQQSLGRLFELDAARANEWVQKMAPPAAEVSRLPPLCPHFLADSEAFRRGAAYLRRGLLADAARAFRLVEAPEREVMAGTHAAALGVDAKSVDTSMRDIFSGCSAAQGRLLLALLLDRAGAKAESHWRLRTEFADILDRYPTRQTAAIWRAAYPLALRPVIAAAERESGIPKYFLQALAREESAFDTDAVSWAGAYGLTQLLVATARGAGKMLSPPVTITEGEQLLEPTLSARLGAALLGDLKRKFGHLGLVLAAYNAGEGVAHTWWKRHQKEPFDVFAEAMTIRETRGYVARVLRTYGIYKWLYGNAAARLPVQNTLPPFN